MNTYNPQIDINEQADIEWHRQQERRKRADTVDFYSDFDKTEGRGILMNRESWICDDCQSLKNHPDKKFKSLKCNKDFHLGIYVCEKCAPNHKYGSTPLFSVEYFNEAWELGVEKFDNCVWILPQRAKALYHYVRVIQDLDTLIWSRRKEYGKYDSKVTKLEKIKHKLIHENDLWSVDLLSTKEKFDIVFGRNDLHTTLLFVHPSIYDNHRSLPSIYQVVYPEGIK